MMNYIVVSILLAIAAHFKGRMDAYADMGIKGSTWHQKYDFTKPGTMKYWWYLGFYKPRFPEKFPFSSTILVCFTDKWHRAQFFMLRAFYIAIALTLTDNWIWRLAMIFVLFPVWVGVFFEASYEDGRKNAELDITDPTPADAPNDVYTDQTTSVPEKQISDL